MDNKRRKKGAWSTKLWKRSSLQTQLVRSALIELDVSPEAFEIAYEAVRQEIWDRRSAGIRKRWRELREKKAARVAAHAPAKKRA